MYDNMTEEELEELKEQYDYLLTIQTYLYDLKVSIHNFIYSTDGIREISYPYILTDDLYAEFDNMEDNLIKTLDNMEELDYITKRVDAKLDKFLDDSGWFDKGE